MKQMTETNPTLFETLSKDYRNGMTFIKMSEIYNVSELQVQKYFLHSSTRTEKKLDNYAALTLILKAGKVIDKHNKNYYQLTADGKAWFDSLVLFYSKADLNGLKCPMLLELLANKPLIMYL